MKVGSASQVGEGHRRLKQGAQLEEAVGRRRGRAMTESLGMWGEIWHNFLEYREGGSAMRTDEKERRPETNLLHGATRQDRARLESLWSYTPKALRGSGQMDKRI